MDSRCSTLLVSGLLFIGGACGGDGPTYPGNGGEDTREILAEPSFGADINGIFQRRGCTASSCHGAPGGQAGLELGASASANYAELVDVQATSESFLRVEPGNANDSYLVIKLEGRQQEGAQMPLGGPALDNVDLTNIKNWINNGASNN